ncbi:MULTISPECIES: Gp138 family membrane-puncturing spike protein [unclassified Clostridium]|uniref:Gp138 family membrane-puncturing spike protein n=1 Tax=unclassified Clostridium TaxID=2614128 RepID=UPI000297963B|nr:MULTISPECIES: Gp138 family membrane-puncturing spike protein [unclassified Clostridium]EKQ56262.1 MAG: hypothetical protein A370_02018 [Clostridium sp. Maddingley MBC34-26]
MSRNINEIIGSENELYKSMGDAWKSILRVACPGIIQSFDEATQTCVIQPAIKEKITNNDYSTKWIDLPLLLDIPIVIPRAGNFCLTIPPKKGDECLVIFADMCIDAWWSLGGSQNQIEKRRHDLSDGFAILGVWSQPNKISNYSTDSCQLRNLSGSQYIEIKDDGINIKGNVNIVGNVKINGTSY